MTKRASQAEAIVDLAIHGLDVYAVGGAIRDALLGLPMRDWDYVVARAAPEAMEARGFRVAGKDFPVFLHPATHAEYALARTERKTAAGYKGFSVYYAPDATLEDDLTHRDLTINAMVQRVAEDGVLAGPVVDPYGGQANLASRAFRHVSDAFMEDPVRILRLARFAAHFTDFHVASKTNALMQRMVQADGVDALMPERVRQEIARDLMEAHPQCMFAVLRDCGALVRLLPELDRLWGAPQRADYHPEVDTGVHTMMVIETAATMATSLPVCFAVLTHDSGKGTTPDDILPRHIDHEGCSVPLIEAVCQCLRVPTERCKLALVVARERGNIHYCDGFDTAALVRLLKRCDALRKPGRFRQALRAYEADAYGRLGFEGRSYPQAARLLRALEVASFVDAGAVAKRHADSPAYIKQAVHRACIEAVAQAGV